MRAALLGLALLLGGCATAPPAGEPRPQSYPLEVRNGYKADVVVYVHKGGVMGTRLGRVGSLATGWLRIQSSDLLAMECKLLVCDGPFGSGANCVITSRVWALGPRGALLQVYNFSYLAAEVYGK